MAKERDFKREIAHLEEEGKIKKLRLQIEQADAELEALQDAVKKAPVVGEDDPELERLVAERKHLDAVLRLSLIHISEPTRRS